MTKVLWFTSKSFSDKQKYLVKNFCQRAGLGPADITFVNIYTRIKNTMIRKGEKSWKYNPETRQAVMKQIDDYRRLVDHEAIVINDGITLSHILDDESSLFLWRGCNFKYDNIRCFVLDDFLQLKTLLHAPWQFASDVKKIVRYLDGIERKQPKFHYEVVENVDDATKAERDLAECVLISPDIETAGNPRFITCSGYSGLTKDGKIISYVFPFYNPLKENNCHWGSAREEERIWSHIRAIHASNVPKTFQNGTYDCAYFIQYRAPVKNFLFDTMHLFRSIWPEAPKKLNFISSICLDVVHYWKDDIKGTSEDDESKSRVPSSPEGYAKYLRYNALDCYNTLLDTVWLINLLCQPQLEWGLTNYINEMEDVLGPALCMTMTGMKADFFRQSFFREKWTTEGSKALKELRIMCDDPEFNPNSNPQLGSLLYDVLGAPVIKRRGVKAKKTKTKTPVGEDVLKLVRTKHPLYAMYIDKVWATKKPFNRASKYGNMEGYNERFIYSLNPVTKTTRYASKEHMLGYGTNNQNVDEPTRAMFVADDGYVLFTADYSACDTWFVAHEIEEENMIRVLHDEKDTHCTHAEQFFGIPYDKIFDGYKKKERWVVDPLVGVRHNTKKISHGAHYQEAGYTVYVSMGHDETVAAAKAAGYEDSHTWSSDRLAAFCTQLLVKYYTFYPGIQPWFKSTVDEAIANGNKAECFGGRTHLFFGNLRENKTQQRFLSSLFGQGGTAGLIRRALLDIYYESNLQRKGMILLTQTHDSITGQVPEDKLHLLNELLTIMEKPVTLKGRTFQVPVELEEGRTWDNGMVEFDNDVTLAEIDWTEIKMAEQFLHVESV